MSAAEWASGGPHRRGDWGPPDPPEQPEDYERGIVPPLLRGLPKDALTTDEHTRILFERMLSREPVWVNSPAGQMTWVNGVTLEDGAFVVFDVDGNDRPASDYLLKDPRT